MRRWWLALALAERYRVVIRACDNTGCSRTVRDKTLPRPSVQAVSR